MALPGPSPRRPRARRWSATAVVVALVALVTACDTPPPGLPPFAARIDVIGAAVMARMEGRSMRPGCPVGYGDLRYLTMSYVGFDGQAHTGEMVVNAVVADDVVSVFRTLYNGGFPIRRMSLVDDFGADDGASMAADNTSAFNCRLSTGSTTTWSEHSYGWAVDVNPLENPYVSGSTVLPAGAATYLNRRAGATGMIVEGDVVTWAFGSIGWSWGGRWTSLKDYQHFVK
jgi:D-alanyl-D-alanine carboxypeptidase